MSYFERLPQINRKKMAQYLQASKIRDFMKFSSDGTFLQSLTLQMLKQGFWKFNESLDYISMSEVAQTTHIDTLSQEKEHRLNLL